MNCDLAFELMTDVQGCENPALHQHLQSCARCRQMRETLAPALDWLQAEAGGFAAAAPRAGPSPAASASTRSVTVASESLEVARLSACRLDVQTARQRAHTGLLVARLCRYAAVLLAGVSLGLFLVPGAERGAVRRALHADCTRHKFDKSAEGPREAAIGTFVAQCQTCHLARSGSEQTDLRLRTGPGLFAELVAARAPSALYAPAGGWLTASQPFEISGGADTSGAKRCARIRRSA